MEATSRQKPQTAPVAATLFRFAIMIAVMCLMSPAVTQARTVIQVVDVAGLYAAVNDAANTGSLVVLAPGLYALDPNNLNAGRLELQMDMALQGVPGDPQQAGAGPYFGAALVPGAIARLQERYPKLDVEIMVGVNDVILPHLFDGALDLAFCRLPAEDALPPFIDRRPFFDIESRIVAGALHPLFAAPRVTARELAGFPWAIYQQDREIVGHLFAMMRDEGARPPRIAAEVNSLTALIQMLKAGRYLSCMAEALVDAYPELGLAVVPFARPILRFPTGALIHRSLERHAPARLLHDLVREHAERLRRC